MDMFVNETGVGCDRVGERWWVFVVTTIVIYIIGISSCFIGYLVFWLLTSRFRVHKRKVSTDKAKTSRIYAIGKASRNYVRQLKSGDTIPGKVLITVTLLCNLAYLALALFRSFPPHMVEECADLSYPGISVELIIVCELLIFALVRFFACNNIIYYWFSPSTIVDVITLPHIFITVAIGVDWIGLRYLRFIWLTQITTVLQLTPVLRSQNIIDITNLIMYFLILWLTSSGILEVIESQGDFWRDTAESNAVNRTILSYMYLTMVTMSTVGYGDITPVTSMGKAFMIIFIIGGLAFFAAILPRLVEVTAYLYQRSQYTRFDLTRVPRHVIVCGHITAATAKEFLKDFLHPDRGDKETHILFLHPERPNKDLKNVLRSFYTRVQFLLGSVMNGSDLEKAHLLTSTAIFILVNKNTSNPTEEDNANLLRVVSVKNTTNRVPVIVQFVSSFGKKQVLNIEGWSSGRDIAVCLNELKLALLAQSCLCPGFSTLIANLFYTASFPKFTSFTGDHAWKEHYIRGASNEVYYSNFSFAFEGMMFHEAASICYNRLNLVLLALEHVEPDLHHFFVNPSQRYHPMLKIKTKAMLGYFIAQDQCHVAAVRVYCECCVGNKHISMDNELPRLRRQLSSMRRHTSLKMLPESKEVVSLTGDASGNSKDNLVIQLDPPVTNSPNLASSTQGEITVSQDCDQLKLTSLEVSLPSTKNSPIDEVDDEVEFGEGSKLKLYTSSRPVKFEEAILNPDCHSLDGTYHKPDCQPNIDDISGHIILCLFTNKTSPCLGLQSFFKPLRSKLLPQESIKPVVIVCEKEYIMNEWPSICRIPKVYIVVGSPLLWSNLKAAKVMECSACVVMAILPTSSGHEQAINDKETILCSVSIQKKLKIIQRDILVITDLRYESNVQFLHFGDDDEQGERIYQAQPFACGEAFSGTMFDAVTCSVFHGPGTLYLVEDLIHLSPTRTCCQVIPVPISDTAYSGRTFGELYNAHLKKCMVCLGLSRKLSASGKQSYVITCPNTTLVLEESDVAFMLTE